MTPNSILLMSGAITNDDMRMHTPVGQDRVCEHVFVCTVHIHTHIYVCVCVGVRRHDQGYIGQTSEARTSPS